MDRKTNLKKDEKNERKMDRKKMWNKIGWGLIYLVIIVNLVFLYRIKTTSVPNPKPLSKIEFKKPTLVVVFTESSCHTCIQDLFFLNDLYTDIRDENKIDFLGIILSQDKIDRKSISKAFTFPFFISNDFSIMSRLNLRHSPFILGLSTDHQILFCDIVPMETGVTEEFIKKGVLDRLYYSLSRKSG